MSSKPLQQLEEWERDLLGGARVAHLGLLDSSGDPRVLPVTFAVSGGRIWSAIDHKRKSAGREPSRLRFLRERPRVALTADLYDDDWSRLAWVQVLGTASLRQPDDAEAAMAALAEKYEAYRRRRPPGPLIAIDPERVLSWRA
jgi:PPOX class probable F420-dependent enzyme